MKGNWDAREVYAIVIIFFDSIHIRLTTTLVADIYPYVSSKTN